jgi:peptidoglycan hydrolase CwlO-like protein
MPTEIVRHLSPEEQELARKRQELAILQSELTDRELSLANLRAELAAFEGRYLREVGALYAELDDWNAKIAELTAAADGSDEAKAAAAEARGQAEESYAAAHGEAAKAADFSPSPELKKLFREVVRQIHPDSATDEADRAVRNRLMAEANLAYRRGDADALRRILEEYKSSPESVKGEGVGADLVRVLRQIDRIVKRLAQIEAEAAELASSEIAKLMAKVDSATASGSNLLTAMAKDLERRIQAAHRQYEAQVSKASAE